MKKINIFRTGVVAMLALASCNTEKLEGPDGGKNVKGVYMSLTAYDENSAPEARTVLGDIDEEKKKAEVNFTSSDMLFVYGSNGEEIQGVQFEANDKGRKTDYNFSTDNWPEGYTPIYAVATTNKTAKNVCTPDGKITMLVNNQTQSFKWSDSYAVNTVGHVGTVENGATVLKNVCGLIQFSVTNEEIEKIVVTANGGEPLGGWITVDYSQLDSEEPAGFYTSGADADMFKAITLTVQELMDNGTKETGGKFPVDNKYFISLLPGVYSKGLTITMFNDEGKVMTREINSSLTIRRGEIRKINNPIDYNLEFNDPEMPETLTFSLLKGKWPFEEKCLAAADQKDGGDEYTYPYSSPEGYNGKFKFVIEDIGGDYTTSSDEIINTASAKAYIKFPAIEGRVLQSITICTRNASPGKSYSISSTTSGKELGEGIVMKEDIKTTWYSDGLVKTLPNTSYYLRMTQSGSKYTKIEAVYVKELSPTPIVVPEEFTAVIDFSEAWPFENKITAKASQAAASETCDGEVYDFKYSETATLKFGICKGQVNEYTHAETEKESGINCLNFPRIGTSPDYADNEGFFKTAAIPGRYLKKVKILAGVQTHTIYICKSNKKVTNVNEILATFSMSPQPGDKTPTSGESGELDGEVNTSYYIFRNKETAQKYIKIELTYATKE